MDQPVFNTSKVFLLSARPSLENLFQASIVTVTYYLRLCINFNNNSSEKYYFSSYVQLNEHPFNINKHSYYIEFDQAGKIVHHIGRINSKPIISRKMMVLYNVIKVFRSSKQFLGSFQEETTSQLKTIFIKQYKNVLSQIAIDILSSTKPIRLFQQSKSHFEKPFNSV